MQDFSKKITIVLKEDVASWQFANTVGHIAAYLGNKMTEPFDSGEYYVSKDGMNFPRNSQFPVVVLRANKDDLKDLAGRIRGTDLSWIVFTQEMIDMADDQELAKVLGAVASEDMNILGIGIFGPKEALKELTGALKLWK